MRPPVKKNLKVLVAPLRHIPGARPGRTYETRLNREQSPLRVRVVPTLSVMLASMLTSIPVITQEPLLPPFGLMFLLSWQMMRPGIWPTWIGLPLGMFDDLFSGQPFGSSAFIWSLLMLACEAINWRSKWRDHWQDWAISSLMIVFALYAGLKFVGMAYAPASPEILLPQILLSILAYPVITRICALLDRWRLAT
jgi:rod shape-determining protein MreD